MIDRIFPVLSSKTRLAENVVLVVEQVGIVPTLKMAVSEDNVGFAIVPTGRLLTIASVAPDIQSERHECSGPRVIATSGRPRGFRAARITDEPGGGSMGESSKRHTPVSAQDSWDIPKIHDCSKPGSILSAAPPVTTAEPMIACEDGGTIPNAVCWIYACSC